MITARRLIATSLRLLGVLAVGEGLAAEEADDALLTLNQLVDSWATDRLLIYVVARDDMPLVPGRGIYTWGEPGGDIPSPRPLQVERVVLRLANQDLEWPLTAFSQHDYALVSQKELPSLYPQAWYYEASFPLGRLMLWPVPTEANTLGLWPWVRLTRFASLDSPVDLPEGYERLLRAGLAADLAPEYGREVSPSIAAILAEAKSGVKRTNTVVPTLATEAAFTTRQQGDWYWQTGDYIWRR